MHATRAQLASNARRAVLAALLATGAVAVDGVSTGCRGGGPPPQEMPGPECSAGNVPIMTAYLETLPDDAIGAPVDGILLSDGQRWLAGQTYLGAPAGLPDGVNVRLLDDGLLVTAFVWLDPGAEPFVLEPCDDGPQRGIRARQAGGGAYAWRALQAEHGLVYTICPPEAWLPADRPSARPPAGT